MKKKKKNNLFFFVFLQIGDYFFQSMLKKISAMGFNIQDKNGNIYIGSVFPGSPAERAGNIFAGNYQTEKQKQNLNFFNYSKVYVKNQKNYKLFAEF